MRTCEPCPCRSGSGSAVAPMPDGRQQRRASLGADMSTIGEVTACEIASPGLRHIRRQRRPRGWRCRARDEGEQERDRRWGCHGVRDLRDWGFLVFSQKTHPCKIGQIREEVRGSQQLFTPVLYPPRRCHTDCIFTSNHIQLSY